MYESFFRFRQRPFLASPTMERYFPGQAIEHARQTLLRSVERAQGPGLLVGPTGTGKTLVCQLLADQLGGSFKVALLANTRLATRKSLLQSILFELGLPFRGLDEGEMRLSLIQHIEPSAECPNGLLLIVDEAHTLPLRLFEELRALTNVVRHGQSRLQLVLAGGSALEEHFTHPKLESFHQRIAARCYLSAFQRSETYSYVLAQLAWADAPSESIFPPESLEAIYRATDGVPRLINQVCDLALTLAAEKRLNVIEPRQIEEAWAELQQLPAPWHNPSPAGNGQTSDAGIIEFGALDDEPSPSRASSPEPSPASEFESSFEPAFETELNSTSPPATSEAAVECNDDITTDNATDDVDWTTYELRGPNSLVVVESWMPNGSWSDAPLENTTSPSIAGKASESADSNDDDANLLPVQLFGDDYSEQEAVVDRFAPVCSTSIASRLRVSSAEGQELGALLNAAIAPTTPLTVEQTPVVQTAAVQSAVVPSPVLEESRATETESAEAALLSAIRSMPSVDDPRRWTPGQAPGQWNVWEFGPTNDSARPSLANAEPVLRPHLRSLPHDDRDLLIVEDDGSGPPPTESSDQGRARRQEYRHLFSRLRRG